MLKMLVSFALGIAAASFCEVRAKDIAKSPTRLLKGAECPYNFNQNIFDMFNELILH